MSSAERTGPADAAPPSENRRHLDRAVTLLHEAAVRALAPGSGVRRIAVEIPVRGNRLGEPRRTVEDG